MGDGCGRTAGTTPAASPVRQLIDCAATMASHETHIRHRFFNALNSFHSAVLSERGPQ